MENPFRINVAKEKTLGEGIQRFDTGLVLELPKNAHILLQQVNEWLVPLKAEIDDGQLVVWAYHISGHRKLDVGDPLAMVELVEKSTFAVRFLEITKGGKIRYGDRKIGHSTKTGDSES